MEWAVRQKRKWGLLRGYQKERWILAGCTYCRSPLSITRADAFDFLEKIGIQCHRRLVEEKRIKATYPPSLALEQGLETLNMRYLYMDRRISFYHAKTEDHHKSGF